MIAAALVAAAPPADLGGWLHDLSPFLVRISGDFGIRYYALSYILGFTAAYAVLRWLAGRRLIAIPPDRVFDALLLLVLGVLIGGRLGYCLLYRPSYLWTFTDTAPWWNLLAINRGGMASHGGMVGVLVAAFLIARGFKDDRGRRVGRCPALHVGDAIALAAPFGLLFGRLANFINGELLGRIVAQPGEPAPWWAVRFPQELGVRTDMAYDARAFAAVDRLITEAGLPGEPEGETIARLVNRLQAGSAEAARLLEPIIAARHPSQLYQAFAEGVVTLVAVWIVAAKRRGPGVVGAWFLIVYGVGRVITEFWRLPDAHFAGGGMFDLSSPRPLGLSRGQWLSVLMIVAGVALLIWRRLRPANEAFLGWAVRPAAEVKPGDRGPAAAPPAS